MKNILIALITFLSSVSFAQLPLEIIAFEAEYVTEANIEFEIQVANVTGVSFLELQLGSDIWNLQGRYKAFPLEQSQVQVIRRVVNVGSNYNYARIRVENIDGSSDYSDLIAFESQDRANTFIIVPGGIVGLSGESIEVIDMDGRSYYGRTDEFIALAPGTYSVRVNREVFRVIISE